MICKVCGEEAYIIEWEKSIWNPADNEEEEEQNDNS